MLCVDDKVILAPVLTDQTDDILPDKGRVWRRRNKSVCPRKGKDGPVLRATVKPVKRFRPDSTPSNLPTTSSLPNAPVNSIPPTQSVKLDIAVHVQEPNTPDFKAKKTNQSPQQTKPSNSAKKKRVREEWSIEDKNNFFDAVAVHGKDFEAIQKTIATKHKKKGDESAIKTKDQVRHLYYRTWTTINKLLLSAGCTTTFSKPLYELCAVINYGELRRKLGGIKKETSLIRKKGILKLNELIHYGTTTVRVKGKNYKIKTPTCKALKRIHDKEDNKLSITETKTLKLPFRVSLEICPLTNYAWNRVHSLAHNPRLRFNIPMDCQVASLITFLTKKWRPLHEKMFEVADNGELLANRVNMYSDNHEQSTKSDLEIHIPPGVVAKSKIDVHQVVLSKTHCIVSYVNQKTLKSNKQKKMKCLPNNDQSFAADSCPSSEEDCGNTDALFDTEVLSNEIFNDSEDKLDTCDRDNPPAKKLFDSAEGESKMDDNQFFHEEFQSEFDIGALVDSADSCGSNESNPVPHDELKEHTQEDDKLNTSMPIDIAYSLNKEKTENGLNETEEVSINNNNHAFENDSKNDDNQLKPDADVKNTGKTENPIDESKNLCKSWNSETAGETTLAEIYIMLGKPSSFKLCYDWAQNTPDDQTRQNVGLCTGIAALLQAAQALRDERNNNVSVDKEKGKQEKTTSNKSFSKPEKLNSNVGVQCSLLPVPSTTSVSTVVGNKKHGRGTSKFTTTLSNSDGSTQFVVPSLPISKKRKTINSNSLSLDVSPSPEEIKFRVQERAGDAQFRKQMEALNRRKDMFRINSHRSTRKPYIVQRAITPHAGSVRKMMTLGIVSSGENNLGFIPAAPITTVSDVSKIVTKTPIFNNVNTSTSSSPVIGDALGIKIQNPNNRRPSVSGESVLERAAQEAGLSLQNPEEQQAISNNDVIDTEPPIDNEHFREPTTLPTPVVLPEISCVLSENVKYLTNHSPIQTAVDDIQDNNSSELPELDIRQPEMMTLNIGPPTPSMDSLLNSLDCINNDSNDSIAASLLQTRSVETQHNPEEMASSPEPLPLNMPSLLDTPLKFRTSSPCYDEDSVDADRHITFATLNTPQRVLQSDNEDSMDSSIFANHGKHARLNHFAGSPFPSSFLQEPDFHLQSLINHTSIDLTGRFQDIAKQQTSLEKTTSSVTMENEQ